MKLPVSKMILGQLITLALLPFLLAALTGCNAIKDSFMQSQVHFTDATELEVLKELNREKLAAIETASPTAGVRPFREIEAFDDDAKSWDNLYSMMGGQGLVVFDANGDGLLDVYICQDGQNWTRPTDENAVLLDKPRYMCNMLYLNQGNDEQGNPLFKSTSALVRRNDTYVEAELLTENMLFPRKSPDESLERGGRKAFCAAAADFNGDGRMDLIVGNIPAGMMWADPSTRRVIPTFVDPIGRQARGTKQPVPPFGLYLVNHKIENGLKVRRASSRGEEFEAANSLFINLGDADGDGIPEWRDVSRETEIEGFRPTASISIADFDLDGDLDVFCGNVADNDFWMAGSNSLAGGINELFINQLAQTGELRFEEKAKEYNVDDEYDADFPIPVYYRLRRIPLLPEAFSFLFFKMVPYEPGFLVINGEEGEHGEISWTTLVQDVNRDGYPDIWVGNDMSYLRLHLNQEGRGFELASHGRSDRGSYWMSLTPADFNRDGREDMFCGSVGGSIHNHSTVNFAPLDLFDPGMLTANLAKEFLTDANDSTHDIFDGGDFDRTFKIRVRHSSILPPDVAIPNNLRKQMKSNIPEDRFDVESLDPYEFAWGSTALDVQNDGYPDLYWIGGLGGRGGGLNSGTGTNPGRLLINKAAELERAGLPELNAAELKQHTAWLYFADETAEHHVFNIQELQYDKLESEGYLYRKAPKQNWAKRDMVYSYDRSVWIAQGPLIQQRAVNQDLIQCCEYGRTTIAADFNGDGFEDIIVRNKGGYDTRSSDGKNLQALIDGRPQVIPAHDPNFPSTTNFEPGSTRMFINTYAENNWLKVRLIDDDPQTFNRDALGARVLINDTFLRVKRGGNVGFAASTNIPLHFGLGRDSVRMIRVNWPDKRQTVSVFDLPDLRNTTLTVSKTRGILK